MRFVVTRFFRIAQRAFSVGEELTTEAIAHIKDAGQSLEHLLALGHIVRARVEEVPPEPAPVKPAKADSKKPPTEAASLLPPASKTE